MNKKLSLILIVSFALTCLTEISPKRVRCASSCKRSYAAAPAREEDNSEDIGDLEEEEEEQELEEENNDEDYNDDTYDEDTYEENNEEE